MIKTTDIGLDKKKYENYDLSQLGRGIHYFFHSFYTYKLIVLFIGIFFVVYIPIFAIIPLFVYLQITISNEEIINSSQEKNFTTQKRTVPITELAVLLLCLLIITIYNSAILVYGDTAAYLEVFDTIIPLSFSDTLEYLDAIRMEPLSMVVMKYIFIALDASQGSFLFITALFISGCIFMVVYHFIPKLYPLILLILTTNIYFYYQLFYLRQFFLIPIIIAFFFLDNLLILTSLLLISTLIHSSSLLLLPVLAYKIFSKYNFLSFLKQNKYLMYGFVIISLLTIIAGRLYADRFLSFFIVQIQNIGIENLTLRVDRYADNTINARENIHRVVLINMGIILFFMSRIKTNKISNIIISLILFYTSNLLITFIAVYTGFNYRISFFFRFFDGLWLTIPIFSAQLEKVSFKLYLFFSSIALNIIFFTYWQYINQRTGLSQFFLKRSGSVTFWESQPLSASLADYIQQLIDIFSR